MSDLICLETVEDVNALRVGDRFFVGEYFPEEEGEREIWEVELVTPYQQLLTVSPTEGDALIVASCDGVYSVVTPGDWDGCCPKASSLAEALALELMRMYQVSESMAPGSST